MSAQSVPNDLILFGYPASPYARRVGWYLALRGIAYAECIQPSILPRPDLEALGVHYRRIPLLAHTGDIYCDSRLILQTLERLFPPSAEHPSLSPGVTQSTAPIPTSYDSMLSLPTPETTPAQPSNTADLTSCPPLLLTHLITRWITDAGIFSRSAALIPPASPALQSPAFLADRSSFSGRPWTAELQARGRAEALVAMRHAFHVLETLVFGDGREWVAGGDGRGGPGLADLEAVWPFWWVRGMDGALPADVFSKQTFPRVWAWIDRFEGAVGQAKKKAGRTMRLEGSQAVEFILSKSAVADGEVTTAAHTHTIDPSDPLHLHRNDIVEVYPTDSGFGHKDVGRLLHLDVDEVVIAVSTPGGGGGGGGGTSSEGGIKTQETNLHFPRWGFRVRKVESTVGPAGGGSARL